jgi:hypothetical protein
LLARAGVDFFLDFRVITASAYMDVLNQIP